jgi:ribosome maturation factor RimP
VYTVVESSFTCEWAKAHFFIAMKSEVYQRLRDAVEQIVVENGLELVDAQLLGGGVHRVFRLFIDSEKGVTHDDCEKISRLVGDALDAGELIPGGAYTLEVSSPGVDRPLLRPKDYARFVGSKVKVELTEPVEKSRRFTGRLVAFEGEQLTLELDKGQTLTVGLDKVSKANVKYEW